MQERSCKGLMLDKGGAIDPRKRKFMLVDPKYFGQKKCFNAPTRCPRPPLPLLCRDPASKMVAKIGHRVKISLQSPTFAQQRTYTVRDKKSTQSMGCKVLPPYFLTYTDKLNADCFCYVLVNKESHNFLSDLQF